MTIRNLDRLFHPSSIVLVGASERPGSIGLHIAENMVRAGFAGDIGFVNPRHDTLLGRPCFRSIEALPFVPGLAVVATPPDTVPGIISELGRKGCRAAVVITAGVNGGLGKSMLEAAKPYLLRIIGPNCLGIQIPSLKVDASFAQTLAKAGDIALVSQSGAITAAMLDWAAVEDVGFSHVVSIGDAADVDLGDMLDYLAGDVASRAVFLYIESVRHGAKFMSAARRCSRSKPVIAIKAGRHPEGARAAASHTGALAGSDSVYSAALRRAGVLRVVDLDEMFDSAEVLARIKRLPGSRVAIVTNGGGAGVIAADTLADLRGELANLEPATLEALNKLLPPTWSHGNPVDIIGDAGPERYKAAMEAVLQDANTDVVLVMNCPTALASSVDAAKATVEAVQNDRRKGFQKPVVATWLAQSEVEDVRPLFANGGVPDFATPTEAVEGIMQLARYARAQAELMQTPPALPPEHFDPKAVDASIAGTLSQGRSLMTEAGGQSGAQRLRHPDRADEHRRDARRSGQGGGRAFARLRFGRCENPFARYHPQVRRRRRPARSHIRGGSREGGAANVEGCQSAASPGAVIEGFTVQPMIYRKGAYELILGMTTDPVFGPIVLFGAGGTGVEAIADTAMSLTPLDLKLASELIASTRIYKLLERVPGQARRRFERTCALPRQAEHACRAAPGYSRTRYQSAFDR